MMNSFEHRMAGIWDSYGDKKALIDLNSSDWTYAELFNQVNRIKGKLKGLGYKQGARVGVFASKSKEIVACFIACLELDMVYVPIDSLSPLQRAKKIIRDGQLNGLIVQNVNKCNFDYSQEADIGDELSLLALDHPEHKNIGLAYILFTSGSTGSPKGVMITLDNALVFVDWTIDKFEVTHQDILTSIAPFHFDLSVFDLYAALLTGASIVLFDGEAIKNPRLLVQQVIEHNVSVLYTTPTILTLMNGFGKLSRYDVSKLRLILFAGEVFPTQNLRRLRAVLKCPMFNLYGPTETNVVTWFKIPEVLSEEQVNPPPIGKVCPYVTGALWSNEVLKEISNGERGELWIKGRSVSQGYLNNEPENERNFKIIGEDKWYKTGDLVEVEKDNLIYRGRIDRMIKRKGYRIELGEVEAAISSHSGVSNSALLFIDGRIKAFIVTIEEGLEYSVLEMNSHCLNLIPSYMLPDDLIYLDSMPMTTSHKVNYQALKKLQ